MNATPSTVLMKKQISDLERELDRERHGRVLLERRCRSYARIINQLAGRQTQDGRPHHSDTTARPVQIQQMLASGPNLGPKTILPQNTEGRETGK